MDGQDKYLPPKKIKKMFDVTHTTLQRWAINKQIKYIITPTNRWLYSLDSLKKQFGITENEQKRIKKYIYCRVSSSKQRKDLQRQSNRMHQLYPDHEIITDVGSGLNWKRKGFNRLLEDILSGNVEEIVVAYKDRLARFGFEMFETVCTFKGTKIVVHNQDTKVCSEKELSKDLLSIINVFVARNNGKRSHQNRKTDDKIKKENNQKNDDSLLQESKKTKNNSNTGKTNIRKSGKNQK